MITKFKLFEFFDFEENNKPEIDENTIRVDGERGWYIDFYFDKNGRKLIYIDNKWDIKVPDWYGFVINKDYIRFWADKYDARSRTFYILKNDIQKYNL